MGPGLLFMALVGMAYVSYLMGSGALVGGIIAAVLAVLIMSGAGKFIFGG